MVSLHVSAPELSEGCVESVATAHSSKKRMISEAGGYAGRRGGGSFSKNKRTICFFPPSIALIPSHTHVWRRLFGAPLSVEMEREIT